MEDGSRALALCGMSESSFCFGRDWFPRHPPADENVVSGHVVYHQSKEWNECSGLAAGSWTGQLPQRMADAPQAEAGDGKTWTGEITRKG